MTDDPNPLNREQRRAAKFHRRGAARQDNLHTQRENSTGFLTTAPTLADEAPRDTPAVNPEPEAEPDAPPAEADAPPAEADAPDQESPAEGDRPAG